MSDDLKKTLVGQKRNCLVTGVKPIEGSKVKVWAVDLEINDQTFPDEVGLPVLAMFFQLVEVGKSYPIDFSLGGKQKDALVGKRPASTDEERAAKKEADRLRVEKERADYEADNAKRGISGGGDPQGDAGGGNGGGGAMIAPNEKHTLLAKEFGFTATDMVLMEQNKIVPKDTPPVQANFFFRTAQLMGLNPLLKQIYLLPFGFGANKGYAIVVAIDSMRAKAIATKEYGGQSKILFDGLSMSEWIREYGNTRKYETKTIPKSGGGRTWNETEYHLVEGRFPSTASVEVIRIIDGKPYTFEAEIAWDEYYPGVSGRGQMWRDRPFGQLGKCCEAIALRKTFADSLSKMYVSEEMDKKAAESEIVDVPHVDWDEVLKGISKCKTQDEVMQHKAAHPQFANDGSYMEAIQAKLDEIARGE